MRKAAILFMVSFSFLVAPAQEDLCKKVKDLLVERNPGIAISGKLIAVNFSSPGDALSREANRAFDRTFQTYRVAKLSGGRQGMIAVTIVKAESQRDAEIAISGDGLSNIVALSEQYFRLPEEGKKNIVFDAGCSVVYRDLAAGEIYESIQKLITR
jgi:hypothetical protein